MSNEEFQIPNNPGQTPKPRPEPSTASGRGQQRSTDHQREITDFGILSLQKTLGAADVQISGLHPLQQPELYT